MLLVLLVEVPFTLTSDAFGLGGPAVVMKNRQFQAQHQKRTGSNGGGGSGLGGGLGGGNVRDASALSLSASGRSSSSSIVFGLWDENHVITPLQLTVALSMAIGVDERHVRATAQGNFFFEIRITGEDDWLLDEINDDQVFLSHVNAQASAFGAKLVISRSAEKELPPPAPASSALQHPQGAKLLAKKRTDATNANANANASGTTAMAAQHAPSKGVAWR